MKNEKDFKTALKRELNYIMVVMLIVLVLHIVLMCLM